jgi:primosomal protein N' (replication factor Y) (superfamily II helicase)
MARSGLRLKAELITRAAEPPSGLDSLAQLWVDTGVFHLDQEFSYLIPRDLDPIVTIGSFVIVPFNGRELTGVVTHRGPYSGQANLKTIIKTQGSISLLSIEQISLIRVLSAKYLCHPFDLIRSIVPQRLATVEKSRGSLEDKPRINRSARMKNSYLQLPPHRNREALIAAKLAELLAEGPTLAVFPNVREVKALSLELDALGVRHTLYDSSQSRSDHYSSYLDIAQGLSHLVIGTRSSVFAPVKDLAHIVIFDEGSEHFYERRTPGWNVREVAIERSHIERVSLTFIGYSPSLDICRLIEINEVEYRKSNSRLKVDDFEQTFGELLPSKALNIIKKSLVNGPVLFVAPAKGWAHAIRCSRCKTLSKCKCGGNFEIKNEKSPVSCNHCGIINQQWKCSWCDNHSYALAGRGIERHAHEIGKLLPGVVIKNSTAEKPLTEEIESGAVITTASMAPLARNGYSAVVFLEGNRRNNQPDMRAQERMRESLFGHSALVSQGGNILLIQDSGNPIVTALRMWNPMPVLERELAERADLDLPPFSHSVELTMPKEEVIRFKNALLKAQDEDRLPRGMRILGPIVKGDNSSLVLLSKLADVDSVNLLIHEFMRRRSLTKKTLPSLRIDPYSLSR